MIGLAVSIVSFVVVPKSAPHPNAPSVSRLDIGGVSIFTAATILFVYGVTSGSVTGWGSANVLAPLVISIAMGAGFFVYEASIDPQRAALPPRVWKFPNVGILVAIGFLPFFWWSSRESKCPFTILSWFI
jgi:hypothetical protein